MLVSQCGESPHVIISLTDPSVIKWLTINTQKTRSIGEGHFASIAERVSPIHLHTYSSKFKTIFIQKSAESDRMSLSPNDRAPITAIKADDRPGAQYLSPSIHHNGEFVVNPQRGTMARVVEGGGRNLSVRMSRAESGVWPGTY